MTSTYNEEVIKAGDVVVHVSKVATRYAKVLQVRPSDYIIADASFVFDHNKGSIITACTGPFKENQQKAIMKHLVRKLRVEELI